MAKVSSRGSCLLCGNSFSKSGMTRHLKSCRESHIGEEAGVRRRSGRRKQGFHLTVEGVDRPWYWMHLEIAGNAPLEALDYYLRQIWLECCGHMSAFTIRGRNHFREDRRMWADLNDLDMEVPLAQALRPGMRFTHEYDFGDTTELALRVVSQGDISPDHSSIRLLARNDPPEIPCAECDSLAAKLCTECYWGDRKFFYCDSCVESHKAQMPSHEEMFLPVVNSPRIGQCGYTGPDGDMWASSGSDS